MVDLAGQFLAEKVPSLQGMGRCLPVYHIRSLTRGSLWQRFQHLWARAPLHELLVHLIAHETQDLLRAVTTRVRLSCESRSATGAQAITCARLASREGSPHPTRAG